MKSIFLTFFLSIYLISCAQETVKGNGKTVNNTRTVESKFHSVTSEGSFEIFIEEGTQDGKIYLEGDSNILEKVKVEVKDGVLKIGFQKGLSIVLNRKVKVRFKGQNLKGFSLAGSGIIKTEGIHKSEKITFAISGSGDIDAKVNAKEVSTAISGSGDIILKGNTDKLSIRTSGSGKVKAFGLNAKNATVSVTGSGDAEINVSESLIGHVAGSGDVKYKGKPEKIKFDAAGSGDIIDAN